MSTVLKVKNSHSSLSKTKCLFAVLVLRLILASPAQALNPSEVPPPFALVSQGGEIVSLSDFRGKVVYLDFWASWCGPCRHTLPWMQKMQKKYKAQGLEVFAVNVDENKADAQKIIDELKPVFTIGFDPTGSVAEKYQLPTMPSSCLIGRDGKIVALHSGFREGDSEEIEEKIKNLLNSKR